MNEEIPMANPPISTEEKAIAAKLSIEDLETIDNAILAHCHQHWRKVAMVTFKTADALQTRFPGLSLTSFMPSGWSSWQKKGGWTRKGIFYTRDLARCGRRLNRERSGGGMSSG